MLVEGVVALGSVMAALRRGVAGRIDLYVAKPPATIRTMTSNVTRIALTLLLLVVSCQYELTTNH